MSLQSFSPLNEPHRQAHHETDAGPSAVYHPAGLLTTEHLRHAPARENGRTDLLSVAQATSHASPSAQLRGNPLQACATGNQRTKGHQDERQVQQAGGPEKGGQQAGAGHEGHAVLLGHGAPEALHQPQRAAQHAHVGGAGGRQCRQPSQGTPTAYPRDTSSTESATRSGTSL